MGNLLRVLAADLPEHSISPLIGTTECLERLFKQKPHSFGFFGAQKSKNQSSNRTKTTNLQPIETDSEEAHQDISAGDRTFPAPNFHGMILFPPASSSIHQSSSSPDPSSTSSIAISGRPWIQYRARVREGERGKLNEAERFPKNLNSTLFHKLRACRKPPLFFLVFVLS